MSRSPIRKNISPLASEPNLLQSVFSGDSEMARLMRGYAWEKTPLGPVADWPQSLRTSVSICLASKFPIVLYWGPEGVVLYNDAYSVILGAKHPWALGQTCRTCWAEIWDTIGPMLDGVLKTGKATWSDDLLLMLRRFGYPEECYFSFSFTPVQVESEKIGGIFTAVIETTEKVIGERRLRTLRDLASQAVAARNENDAWQIAGGMLAQNDRDIPFAILCKAADTTFQVVSTAGISPEHELCKQLCQSGSELYEKAVQVSESGRRAELSDLGELAQDLPSGSWETAPRQAVLLPIVGLGQNSAGVLLLAASPAKRLDESYRTFFDLLSRQISTNIAEAYSHEEERRRAAALAERDELESRRLRESEQKLRVVTEAAPVMIWMSGTDKLCFYFNKSWLDFVGRTLEQELGNGWADDVHPDDLDRCIETYVTAFDARRPFEMEYRIRHHSGQYRWILDRGVPRFAPDGMFEGYVGGCLDIHEQKEAAEKLRIVGDALRESEERLRLAQQAAGIGTFEWNLETGVNRWTPELELMYGLKPGTFEGSQEAWKRLVHSEDLPAVLKQVDLSVQTGAPTQAEWRVIWPDGSIHWVLGRWQLFKDEFGNATRVAGINVDVTARKADEEARRRLAAIVESSDDAIISKDLNSIVTSWNPQAQRMFGYTEQEMVGQSILTLIPPELHGDEDMILGKIRRGEKIDHFETVRVTKSGERIEVSLSISPVRDEQGNIVGAAKIARDIRESKKIERALRTTEKLAAAGRLAATVAHEINNPLEAVTNLVYLAARELPYQGSAAAHLHAAEQELRRIAHITRQTLGFYRDPSSPVRLNVPRVFDDLLVLYEKRLETRNIRVVRDFDSSAEVIALSGEIRQALSNLLTNAMDAMISGGTLMIRVRKAHAWRSAHIEGVRITVADSGSGIAPEDKRNLFQPFFTTKSDVGTGLGLWVTRSIVEKHSGRIQVKSRTGANHGSVFSIFLPVHGIAAGDHLAPQAAPPLGISA